MDSFYGAPRQPPSLPTINPIRQTPVVPEVSMIENPRSLRPCDFNSTRNILNVCKDSSFMSKKQVRFEGPEKENVPQVLKAVPDLKGKTFKQIYMANVPDRHLDLSIFEPPRQENKNSEPSPNLNNSQCNTNLSHLKSIENRDLNPKYKDWRTEFFSSRPKPVPESPVFSPKYKKLSPPKQTEICVQTDPVPEHKCTEIATKSDEPTIRDLLKIIQQQNEQIMELQKQVSNLTTNYRQPEIAANAHQCPVGPPFMKELTNSPSKKGMFQFDVKATSVVVSCRPQQKYRKQNDYLEPTIEEIYDNSTENPTNSLHLDESLDVKDSYVSTVQSIAIEMDKFENSDEEEESEVGLSFYKEMMNQVHNALKSAQSEYQMNKQEVPNQVMKTVKQATLQHLKNIGVHLSPIQESTEHTDKADPQSCDQSEVSYAVQQLLMKYLPPEKLAKVVNKPKGPKLKEKEKKLNPQNAEFSMATLQYMKKYNLIDNTGKLPNSQKFLNNVTALKLQPKLPIKP